MVLNEIQEEKVLIEQFETKEDIENQIIQVTDEFNIFSEKHLKNIENLSIQFNLIFSKYCEVLKENVNMKKFLSGKDKQIDDLEKEKSNWSKVSYCKILDRQLQEKNKELEILQKKFNTTQNNNKKLRNEISELKESLTGNYHIFRNTFQGEKNIDMNLNEIEVKPPISENNASNEDNKLLEVEPSISENNNENNEGNENNASNEDNKLLEVEPSISENNNENNASNEDNKLLEVESSISENNNENNEGNKDNKLLEVESSISENNNENNESENNSSTSEENKIRLLDNFKKYDYINKKGEKKKYLIKEINNKTYIFKYTKKITNEAIGELRFKDGVEKPVFYKKIKIIQEEQQ